jgi:hypothetical protein
MNPAFERDVQEKKSYMQILFAVHKIYYPFSDASFSSGKIMFLRISESEMNLTRALILCSENNYNG